MVYYYTIRGGACLNAHSHIVLQPHQIICYVGRDKEENEYLIKYGWPGDVWFHVDSLSSAHVYFRVKPCPASEDSSSATTTNNSSNIPLTGIPIDDLPVDAVYDMMQICKHNSIAGCKLASTRIVYTSHSNLCKTFDMADGAVTYHDRGLCRYDRCDKDRVRIKELERTKTERTNVDFYQELKDNERRIIARKKRERQLGSGGGAGHKGNDNDLELYDPIRDDRNTRRIREHRQGDDETGVDKALEALESLVFAPVAARSSSGGGGARYSANALDDNGNDDNNDDTTPAWVTEAKHRSRAKGSSDVCFLVERGYTAAQAKQALLLVQGSRRTALACLWRSHCDSASSADDEHDKDTFAVVNMTGGVPEAKESSHDALAARTEEKEVLQAIFGEDEGALFHSEDETRLDSTLPITSYEPPERYQNPPALRLEVYTDDGMAPGYPVSSPPVLALVGGGFSQIHLHRLTCLLAREACERSREEPGDPQIFNLLAFIAEQADSVVELEAVELETTAKEKVRLRKEAMAQAAAKTARRDEATASLADSTFKNEQERRAYAMNVLSSVGLKEPPKKKEKEPRYNTGVSDKSLINDLFG